MGGMFRAPRPMVIAAPEPPAPPSGPDPAEAAAAAEAARIEARGRVTRGRAGTILTSERGVLGGMPLDLQRKSLLGE